jgi:hypothetical protein
MNMPVIEVPKWALTAMNNLSEMERKISISGDPSNLKRNIERIRDALEGEVRIFFEDPMGQPFNETRTDLDATITGTGTDDLVVVEVLKPIVRVGTREYSRVVQKGIVFVESRTTQANTDGVK